MATRKSNKKKKSKSKRGAGKGMGVFNPLNPIVPPTLYGDKGVFKMAGTARTALEQTASKNYLLMCAALPGSGTIGCYIRWAGMSAVAAEVFTAFTVPLLASNATSGGPTSSRVTKIGLRCTNATTNMYLGGQLCYSQIAQRLKLPAAPSVMTGAQWDAVMTTLRGLPQSGPTRTVPLTWSEFGQGGRRNNKPFTAVVSDEVKYAEYINHSGTVASIDDYFNNVAVWPGSVEEPRPMSTLVFTWSTPSDALRLQDLVFNFDAQFLTRWPLDTVPGVSAKDEPGSSSTEVERSRRDWGGSS